jgi:hypothetical protein
MSRSEWASECPALMPWSLIKTMVIYKRPLDEVRFYMTLL